MIEIVCVVGARPNFMKMAPILDALRAYPDIKPYLVHTGQHYDEEMSRVFFVELGLPRPDKDLEVGSDSHGRQTGKIMMAFDSLLDGRSTRMVVVVGDVNSTVACSLVAVKRGILVAHVEAGLRSRDRTMPEEINRLVTDAISDILLVTSPDGIDNLRAEGVPASKIHLVGNPMIDSIVRHRDAARARNVPQRFGLAPRRYGLVTLHRPSNVDDPDTLAGILESLQALARRVPILFPVHPRTRERIRSLGFQPGPGLALHEPLGYLDFLGLMDQATFVLTDSGGIQEETAALGVPCLTLRANTERPITLTEGTNRLLGTDPRAIVPAATALLDGDAPAPRCPALWDGHAGQRIAKVLADHVEGGAPAGSRRTVPVDT
ncbi:MAG TPA: UDP-N-acetylglucosamine 2-epimerase (non-hydrolyzing) [Candidatus Eisenbacteria bacterium]|nr:UDP-N-acetylglucosamine 2-epimerase (non-hydrolyzing) [Candidatus Eisenbacteria bacterium]